MNVRGPASPSPRGDLGRRYSVPVAVTVAVAEDVADEGIVDDVNPVVVDGGALPALAVVYDAAGENKELIVLACVELFAGLVGR